MSSLAARMEPWSSRRMAGIEDVQAERRRIMGVALKTLRKRAGLSQEAAADAAGVHTQTWRNYELGNRAMDNPTLARLTAAIGSNAEEHAVEMARLTPVARDPVGGYGVAERGRVMQLPVGGIAHGGALRPNVYDDGGEAEVIDFARFFAPGTQVLRLAGMSMVPYAEPGGFVTYNVRQPARRGHGCVIEMLDGSYAVKRFERMDDETLYVTELYPEERPLTFPLSAVKGVYAIGLRGD